MTSSSKIFARYRVLGYVSNHIPVVARYIKRRREYLFVTCVGKSFHTYSFSQLALLTVSDLHPEDITCIAGDSYLIFTAAGTKIYAWRRGTELKHVYEAHEYPIRLLFPFGPHLISIDDNSSLKVWNIRAEDLHLELEFNNNVFEITAIMHPSTYLNKILLGSEQGTLQLWNLNTSKLIYTFRGWNSGVTVIEQSPTVDVVAIGLKNGRIIIHNLKFDETLMEFRQDWGMVTGLTFRLDDTPFLISGTTNGHLIVWDLEGKKLFSQLLTAHEDAVTGLKCLLGMPMMITSSPDNSLKLWVFDMPDGGPRLLIRREGHSRPPTFIRFHGSNGHNILSAGGDSHLRIFNTVTERFNKSLGKASRNRNKSKKKGRLEIDVYKMPPIVRFTSETTREKEWDNIGAIHLATTEVTTWSYHRLKMGDFKLIHDRFKKKGMNGPRYQTQPVSLHLSHCGNFILIGYTSGHCDRYNIQSGIHRATYGSDKAHEGPVRGVTSDLLNRIVITGGGDNCMKWWNFKDTECQKEISRLDLSDAVAFFTIHDESSLTAVALEDFTILLVDNEGRNIIRRFEGHSGRVTDMTFSPDCRWLITSGADCCVFTWDVPSGCLVDHFRVDAACTSLAFSPTGEFLATTHVEYLGVFLWANRTLYEHMTLKPIKNRENIPLMGLPSVTCEATEQLPEAESDEEEFQSPGQIEDLITLSNLPESRWHNLLNLDIIKRRNKPREKLEVSKTAPFFLPTVPAPDITFDLSGVEKINPENQLITGQWDTLTTFGTRLKEAQENGDFEEVFEKLKCMGPSMIDHEINSLSFSSDPDVTNRLLSQFMKMIDMALKRKVDFEVAQAYLALFLKVHGETLTESEQLLNDLETLKESQNRGWKKLEKDFHYNLSVIKSLKL